MRTEVISLHVRLDNDTVTAGLEDKDVLRVSFIPVAEGINGNGDEFPREELQKSVQTFVGKPILVHYVDLENAIPAGHRGAKIVGAILTAEGREDEDGRYKVFCEGIIYARRFPREARAVLKQYAENRLFFSMETFFTSYVSTPTSRQLRGLTFTGAAIVDRPAEPAAIGLSVGAEGEPNEGGNTMELEALQKENESLKAELAKVKAELEKERSAKIEAEAKASATEEKAEKIITELNAKIEVAEAKIAELTPIAEKAAELQAKVDEFEKLEAERKANEKAEARIAEVEKYLKLSPEDREIRKQRYRDMSEEAFAEVIASLETLVKQAANKDGAVNVAALSSTTPEDLKTRYRNIWK